MPLAIADDMIDPAVLGGSAGSNDNASSSTAFLHPDGSRSKEAAGAGVDAGGKGGEDKPGMVSLSVFVLCEGAERRNCHCALSL